MADEKQIKVVTASYNGATYSQLVGVTVTDFDVTLEFVYIHPRKKDEGTVVSRVTLPKPVAMDLARTIGFTIQSHNKKTDKN